MKLNAVDGRLIVKMVSGEPSGELCTSIFDTLLNLIYVEAANIIT